MTYTRATLYAALTLTTACVAMRCLIGCVEARRNKVGTVAQDRSLVRDAGQQRTARTIDSPKLLTGTVTDAAGRPLANVELRLRTYGDLQDDGRVDLVDVAYWQRGFGHRRPVESTREDRMQVLYFDDPEQISPRWHTLSGMVTQLRGPGVVIR